MSATSAFADSLPRTHRDLADSEARLPFRVGAPLQRPGSALQNLSEAETTGSPAWQAPFGTGSLRKQPSATWKRLIALVRQSLAGL